MSALIMNEENKEKSKKRVRDESDSVLPEERVDSDNIPGNSPETKRTRSVVEKSSKSAVFDSDESEGNLSQSNRLPNDLFGILDEPDAQAGDEEELESVIRSFEEEIYHPSPLPSSETALNAALALESSESQPDLGYLLEASDDELGLPLAVSPSSSNEQTKRESDESTVAMPPAAVGLGEMLFMEQEIQMPCYNSFDFGICEEDQGNHSEFVMVGGLFDYGDPSDVSEFSCRPEYFPVL